VNLYSTSPQNVGFLWVLSSNNYHSNPISLQKINKNQFYIFLFLFLQAIYCTIYIIWYNIIIFGKAAKVKNMTGLHNFDEKSHPLMTLAIIFFHADNESTNFWSILKTYTESPIFKIFYWEMGRINPMLFLKPESVHAYVMVMGRYAQNQTNIPIIINHYKLTHNCGKKKYIYIFHLKYNSPLR